MTLVKLKQKGQMTLPTELRETLALNEGDLLEATIEDGKIMLTPMLLINRDTAFARIAAIAEQAEASWRNDDISNEEMEAMILAEVRQARVDRKTEERHD